MLRAMRWLGLLVVSTCGFALVACGFAPATSGDAHVNPGEGGGNEMVGSEPLPVGSEPAALGCYGNGLGVVVCLATPPTTDLTVSILRIVNTTEGSFDCVALTGSTMHDYCVLAGTSVNISGFLVASGSRPLVILSLSTLDVTGTIDVASHRNASPQFIGPGGDGSCNGVAASQTAAGGFGGSFGSRGGDGGSTAPPDGQAGPVIVATTLRGGCPGGSGLDFSIFDNTGGHGGGAVDLIAVNSLSVLGTINASGSGGGGAQPASNGAGGGGSGGMIVLDAPLMTFDNGTTAIFANGGGGGGGSSNNVIIHGSAGGDPGGYASGGTTGGAVGPFGNPSNPTGGDGGAGASTAGPATPGDDGKHGGGNGGGGGGLGVIRILGGAPLPTAGHFSPQPT